MSEKNKIDFSLFASNANTKKLNINPTEPNEKVEETTSLKNEDAPIVHEKDIAEQLDEDVAEILETEVKRMMEARGDEPVETPFSRPMRVVVVGGSKDFFEKVKEDVSPYSDIDVVKYIPTGNTSMLYAIEATKADVILAHHKMNLQSPAELWSMINEESDDKGTPYKEIFKDLRMVTIVPNFQMESQLRAIGLNLFVEEINHPTFGVDTRTLVNRLRYAFFDITNEKRKRLGMPELNINEIHFPEPEVQTETQAVQTTEPIASTTPAPAIHERTMMQSINEQVAVAPALPKVIGIYSATGGAGTTMFATNIASILSKYSNMDNPNSYRVALVEYNLSCQSIDMAFDLKTDKNLAVLANELLTYYDKGNPVNPYKISHETLRPIISRYMVKEPNTGLDILLGIPVPLEIEKIKNGFTTLLFETLKEMYDVIIVDLSTDIAKSPMLEALYSTDEIYYIMPMDTVSIRNTRILAKFFVSMFDFKQDEVKIILNKIVENNENFGVKQVYAVMENNSEGISAPVGNIPFIGDDVRLSLDNGIPIALSNPEHPITQAIRSIAVMINPMLNDNDIIVADNKKSIAKNKAKNEKKGGLLGGLFGGSKKSKEKEETKKAFRSRKAQKEDNVSNEETIPVVVTETREVLEEIPYQEDLQEENNISIQEDSVSINSEPQMQEPQEVDEVSPTEEVVEEKSITNAQEINEVSNEAPEPEVEDIPVVAEPPKKKGFFARLFGGGEKKEKKLKKDKEERPSKFKRRKPNQ